MFTINQYWGQARARAKRRRNPWNLAIFFIAFIFDGLTWWALVKVGEAIHLNLYREQFLRAAMGIGPILTTGSPLLIVVPTGFLFGNFCIWLIPSARIALDREAGSDPKMTFRGSQNGLLKFATVAMPIGVVIMAIGILCSWI